MSDDYGSRFGDGEEGDVPAEFWRNSLQRAINGRRGQRLLMKFERYLRLMPTKRLIRGAICADGEVCAVGAFAVGHLMDLAVDRDAALAALPQGDGYADYETAELGEAHGLQRVLAWEIAHLNDEVLDNITPEERYEQVLDWVRNQIIQPSPSVKTS